jgi:hypothetical protein
MDRCEPDASPSERDALERAAMRRWVAMASVVVPLLAGCSGTHAAGTTHVEGLAVVRDVGCSGWFEVTGQTLAAHLIFVGPVRNLVVSTTSDNGFSPTDDLTVRIPHGVTSRTVHVGGVTRVVVGARATVDNGAGARASCTLATPH